ncbi:hypothetical protein ACFO4E_18170 [Nocardiopsis mangrovi]|uniref:Secreted protein n=1 Tax=Nocardiopsis mangrovi TaxID=1179818 RepID=A0ABV9E0R7_9ACTN
MKAITAYAAATVFAGLLLTGCGATGGSEEGSGGSAGGVTGASSADREEALLEYTECMRDNGVDMPDPDPDGGALEALEMNETTEAALEECEDLMPVNPDAPSEEEQHERALALAECMRENGIDVPDPQPGQGLQLTQGDGSDEQREASAECIETHLQIDPSEGPAGQ